MQAHRPPPLHLQTRRINANMPALGNAPAPRPPAPTSRPPAPPAPSRPSQSLVKPRPDSASEAVTRVNENRSDRDVEMAKFSPMIVVRNVADVEMTPVADGACYTFSAVVSYLLDDLGGEVASLLIQARKSTTSLALLALYRLVFFSLGVTSLALWCDTLEGHIAVSGVPGLAVLGLLIHNGLASLLYPFIFRTFMGRNILEFDPCINTRARYLISLASLLAWFLFQLSLVSSIVGSVYFWLFESTLPPFYGAAAVGAEQGLTLIQSFPNLEVTQQFAIVMVHGALPALALLEIAASRIYFVLRHIPLMVAVQALVAVIYIAEGRRGIWVHPVLDYNETPSPLVVATIFAFFSFSIIVQWILALVTQARRALAR